MAECTNDAAADSSRAVAITAVTRWLAAGDFPDRVLPGDTPDHAFVMEVVYGVARWRRMLEWAIGRYVRTPPPHEVMACLLTGAYQILRMDTVPPHAAVNETVEAAKRRKTRGAVGFVNAVLRSLIRERDTLLVELAAQDLGVRESHPDLLVRRWTRAFGEAKAERLCAWDNTRPEVVITPNSLVTSAAGYLERLHAAGLTEAAPHPAAPAQSISIPRGTRVVDLPGFAEGAFTVQDPSTLVSVGFLAPRGGERILDACAAPGGKSMLIAERMGDRGELVAVDLHADRVALLRENISRLRLSCVRVAEADLSRPGSAAVLGAAPFDRVLLDVPCTNTGVLRRRPDARWRFTEERLRALVALQTSLLENTAALLAPGGTLVYSTCSLEAEEGDALIEAWLKRHPDFHLADSALSLPPDCLTDGMFAACLRRRA
jgi:16S rRNA (cytosine967-C5)-methyltransferase